MPGREGDIWLAGGEEWDNTYGLWHSTDSGASFVKLANVEEADNIGFGKAATGQTYPALYAVAQIAGVRGIFRSIDAGQTCVRINDNQHQWGPRGRHRDHGRPRASSVASTSAPTAAAFFTATGNEFVRRAATECRPYGCCNSRHFDDSA